MLGNPFNIKKLNEIGSFFIFKLGLILRFLSISRRDFVSNSGLLVESTTQIGAEIVLLNGAAYPEFRLVSFRSLLWSIMLLSLLSSQDFVKPMR